MTMNGGMSEVSEVSSLLRTMGTSNKNTNLDEIQDLSLIPMHEIKKKIKREGMPTDQSA